MGIILSEWKPFVTVDLIRRNEKHYDTAVQKQQNGEKIQIWPYERNGKTYYLVIYAKSFFPPRFHPEGFLILTKNGELVQEKELCQRTAQDFLVWQRLYHKPPFKYNPKQYFDLIRKNSNLALDICRRRYEKNLYDNANPAKRRYNEVLRKLDLDVIENNKLILMNLALTERIIQVEKTIWQRCSWEKTEKLRNILIEFEPTCLKMAEYWQKRGELFYEYEREIKEAYKIDLQVTSYSLISKASLSFLLWLANSNLAALAIPYLPEVLKVFYQELVGHKSLLRKSKKYVKKTQEIASLLNLYHSPLEDEKIRNN